MDYPIDKATGLECDVGGQMEQVGFLILQQRCAPSWALCVLINFFSPYLHSVFGLYLTRSQPSEPAATVQYHEIVLVSNTASLLMLFIGDNSDISLSTPTKRFCFVHEGKGYEQMVSGQPN
ncbi:hypothetical protein NDU88_008556 [Pleurodeles waltl]|uniref:Uncharacterized protein n=1 Tax=Pleurodeles waltl TaxID=8319 RepID=A0AAV7PQ48_PLEWA|nr:hypothetical protein NDU88_008556 [Pleurodeles waltl]